MKAILFTLLSLAAASQATFPAEPIRPNFIVIFADDLGYGDLGCYGSTTIATPRIDRMAAEGVRFTDAYSASPFCSPSRAALLTGRLPARCGVPYVLFPAEHHGLPRAEVTLAQLLSGRGYMSAIIGKWHLGWDRAFRPLTQGFNEFYGTPYSNDSTEWAMGEPFMQVMGLEPFPLMDGERVVEAPADQSTLTRRYTERAVDFIRRHQAQPFFLYLTHTMPHIPQYASPAFEGRSQGGLYGDCIEELDWNTGVILDTLRELGIADKTLVIFTSDNGASLAGKRPGAPKQERFPGRTFGGSNGPLRAGKGTTYEGGVRVPFITWWPGKAPAGSVINAPISMMDLFPTVAALAGAEVPQDRVYDGQNIAAELAGEEPRIAAPPVFHYFGLQLQAVRQGKWKLFVKVDSMPDPRPYSLWFEHQPLLFGKQHRLLSQPELYDLSQDIGETTNVAAQHPEVVERLTRIARIHASSLKRDRRSMEFVDGPPPPAPQTIRTAETDLGAWKRSRDATGPDE